MHALSRTEIKEMFANKKTHLHKLFLIWFFAYVFYPSQIYAQNISITDTTIYTTINAALSNGNIDILEPFFNKNIDITLPNNSDIFSNKQALYILKEFFKTNPPTLFQPINQNFNNGSNFIVGKMHTKNQHYRVCYITKYTDNKLLIYQIRIEK